MYRTDQLPLHIVRALGNGVTREEIGEIFTHIAFYAGWPDGRDEEPHRQDDLRRGSSRSTFADFTLHV
jgi:hypothetical protein